MCCCVADKNNELPYTNRGYSARDSHPQVCEPLLYGPPEAFKSYSSPSGISIASKKDLDIFSGAFRSLQ